MKAWDVIKYIISAAVAAALLYFSFRGVKWDDFVAALKSCRWGWVLAAMLAGVSSFWLRALRWRRMLLPIDHDTTRKATFNAINIGYLANIVLPRIGEFVRCGFITRHSSMNSEYRRRASYDKVLGTVVTERSWDILTMMIIAAFIAILFRNSFGDFFSDRILHPVSESLDIGKLAILSGIFAAGIASVIWMIWRFRGRWRIGGKIAGVISGLWEGLNSCFRMEKGWTFIVYTLLIWLMYWFMSYSVLLSLQGIDGSSLSPGFSDAAGRISELGAVDALFLMLAGSLSSLVPVPGGFGAFHYIVASALYTVYGIPFWTGTVFATLSHESQIITQAACGLASYISESLHPDRR